MLEIQMFPREQSWLAMIVGSIGVSLIRDAGFVIFPWAVLLPGVLFIAGSLLAVRLKFRKLSRSLSPGAIS